MEYNNAIVSTAILSSIFEKHKKDIIGLIMPFLQFVIDTNYSINSELSIDDLSSLICEQFGYECFPNAVVVKMLSRLAKDKNIVREQNKYYYKIKFDEVAQNFLTKRNEAQNLIERIIRPLSNYMNTVDEIKKSDDAIKKCLFSYLEKYGLYTFIDINKIKTGSRAQEKYNYLIAKYILDAKDNNPLFFNDLLELVKGIMLAKAIYLQLENNDLSTAKFKDIYLFIDTALLLRILGLKTPNENETANQLLKFIPANIKLRCFEENFEELQSILRTYRQRLVSCIYASQNGHTLEYFDANHYSETEVDNFYLRLEQKLRDKKIEIYSYDEFSAKANTTFYSEEDGLKQQLIKWIPSYNANSKALENDIKAISNIYRLREGKSFDRIENCKALFITTNYKLVNSFNNFSKEKFAVSEMITDIDLTVIFWLKNYTAKSNLPRELLISNAIAGTQNVSDVFESKIFQVLEKLKKEGTLTEAEAEIIRRNQYAKIEILNSSAGDPEKILEETVISLRDRFKEESNLKLSAEKEKIKSENLNLQQEKSQQIDRNMKFAGDEATKFAKRFDWGFKMFIVLLILGVIAYGIIDFIIKLGENKISIISVLSLLVSTYCLADIFISKLHFIKKLNKKIYYWAYSKKYDSIIQKLMNC